MKKNTKSIIALLLLSSMEVSAQNVAEFQFSSSLNKMPKLLDVIAKF